MNYLYKKDQGVSETDEKVTKYEEPYNRLFDNVPNLAIWAQASLIPSSAPLTSSGVVKKITSVLTLVTSRNNSCWRSDDLKDCILAPPYHYSYAPVLYVTGSQEVISQQYYRIDNVNGLLKFIYSYPDLMSKAGLTIDCYQYVGSKGIDLEIYQTSDVVSTGTAELFEYSVSNNRVVNIQAVINGYGSNTFTSEKNTYVIYYNNPEWYVGTMYHTKIGSTSLVVSIDSSTPGTFTINSTGSGHWKSVFVITECQSDQS